METIPFHELTHFKNRNHENISYVIKRHVPKYCFYNKSQHRFLPFISFSFNFSFFSLVTLHVFVLVGFYAPIGYFVFIFLVFCQKGPWFWLYKFGVASKITSRSCIYRSMAIPKSAEIMNSFDPLLFLQTGAHYPLNRYFCFERHPASKWEFNIPNVIRKYFCLNFALFCHLFF